MTPDFPLVSIQELVVLEYLVETWPAISPQAEVQVAAGFKTRRTAKRHLDRLIESGLVGHDRLRRGYFSTEKGRELVAFTGAR